MCTCIRALCNIHSFLVSYEQQCIHGRVIIIAGQDFAVRASGCAQQNVPEVVGQNCEKFAAQLLQGTELKSDTVNWAVHPGGKAVVDAVEKPCGLEPEQLRWTRYDITLEWLCLQS